MNKKDIVGIKELILTLYEAIDYCKGNTYKNISPIVDDFIEALSVIKDTTFDEEIENYIIVFKENKLERINEEFFNSLYIKLNSIFKDINSIKKEVVFLPYNATMWDSLESIWLAANEDERCECYVIPIPYYNKNQDSSLGELIYDGDKFPEYVPITHYSEYNLSERSPDIIYFHNPYDNYNRVTTVHQDYYSSKLKEYTNMLVYVPYFVVNHKLKEEFCILPGVKNANYVIVQSEEIANEYKKYYLYQDRNKFLPLGSPKIDKVISMTKEEYNEDEIPNDWKNKIKGKKVILYNTHLYSIMNDGEALIKKIKYVLSVFEKQRDVVLLWRPHPLSEKTAKSINPEILDKFKDLEEAVKNSETCIFDDTPNLHRSISISDGYFGDRSSLVELFRNLKKPVMVQDINIQNEIEWKDLNRIPFDDAYINDKEIWFASTSFNGLFCLNKGSGKIDFKGHFPSENIRQTRLFCKVVFFNNKLMFIPYNASAIMIYDIEIGAFERIELLKGELKKKFWSYSIYKNYIYIMPLSYGKILRYNIKTGTLENMNSWNEHVKKHGVMNDMWFRDVIQKDGKLYCPFYQSNFLFVFDLETNKIENYEIGNKEEKYISIQNDGEKFWLIPKDLKSILCWDKSTNEYLYFDDYPIISKFSRIGEPFLTTITVDESIWILPCFLDYIIKIDKKSMTFEDINIENKTIDNVIRDEMFWNFGGIKTFDDKLVLLPMNSEDIITINKNGKIKEITKSFLPEGIKSEIIKNPLYNEFGDFIEENLFGLREYIKKIKNEKIAYNSETKNQELSGKIISDFFLG